MAMEQESRGDRQVEEAVEGIEKLQVVDKMPKHPLQNAWTLWFCKYFSH